jgi:hypothetical protein
MYSTVACSLFINLDALLQMRRHFIGEYGGLRAVANAILFHIDIKMLQKEDLATAAVHQNPAT